MALTFKNRVTGRVVEMLEPDELKAHLAKVRRRGRRLDPKRIFLAGKTQKRVLDKMAESWKWARVGATSEDEAPAGEPERPAERANRAEWDAYAETQGVENPQGLPSKAAVIEAVDMLAVASDEDENGDSNGPAAGESEDAEGGGW